MTRKAPKTTVTAAVLSSVVAIAGIAPTAAVAARRAGITHPKKAKPRIAFIRYKVGGSIKIVTMDESGKHPKTVKSRPANDDDKDFTSAELSPDGKRIVYTQGIGTEDAEIWTVKANGKGAKRIVNPPGHRSAFSPTWSPDGKKIVYTLTDNDDFASLVVADADGKHPKTIYKSTSSYEVYPSWSPDGKQIVFSIRAGETPYRVATVKSSGGGFKYLTKPKPVVALAGGYSPDGKRIVFLEIPPITRAPHAGTSFGRLDPVPRGGPTGAVISIKANGKGRKVIDGDIGTFGRIVHSADGKRIIASHVENDNLDLCAHPLGPGPWKCLTHTEDSHNLFDFFQVLYGD